MLIPAATVSGRRSHVPGFGFGRDVVDHPGVDLLSEPQRQRRQLRAMIRRQVLDLYTPR